MSSNLRKWLKNNPSVTFNFKQVHIEEIDELLGSEGIWFNTEVLIAVGEK